MLDLAIFSLTDALAEPWGRLLATTPPGRDAPFWGRLARLNTANTKDFSVPNGAQPSYIEWNRFHAAAHAAFKASADRYKREDLVKTADAMRP